MNFVYHYLSKELVNAIGWTIFHSIWQGVVLALLLVITLFFANKKTPRVKYAISVSVLFIFVIASSITFFLMYKTDLPSQTVGSNQNFDKVMISGVLFENPVYDNKTSSSIFDLAQNYFIKNLTLFVLGWFVGLMFFSLRFIIGVLYLQRVRFNGLKELDVEWLYRSRELAKKLGIQKFVLVYESVKVKIPIVLGYLKPIILLPIGMINALPYTQVESIIAHELAHIKRYDFLVNLLQSFIETVFFYHPAIWWISGLIREERENCCDDLTIEICKDTLVYSKALYNLYQINQNHPEFVLALSGNKNLLIRRIKRMNGEKSKLSYGGKFATLIFIFVFITTVFAFSSPNTIDSANNVNINKSSAIATKNFSSLRMVKDLSTNDTISFKKGKHTLKYKKDVAGKEKQFKAKLNNGKLEKLYIDGEEVAKKDLQNYEKDITDRVESYDNAMKNYRNTMEELRTIMNKQKEKMEELRLKLGDLRAEHRLPKGFHLPDRFVIPMMDSAAFYGMITNIQEAIQKTFANKSITIPPVHLPKVIIPPFNFDDDSIEFDRDKFETSINAWGKAFKESMTDFSKNMKDNKIELEKMSKEISKTINSAEFKKSMSSLKENLKKLKNDSKILKEFMLEVKNELVKDGVIKEGDDIDGFYLSTKEMKVNYKIVSEELHQKYLALYKKHYGKDLKENQKFNFED